MIFLLVYSIFQDGSIHKVIFIEKPFIEKNLSKRDKNEKFYKKSLLFTLTKEISTENKRVIGLKRHNQSNVSQQSNSNELKEKMTKNENKDDKNKQQKQLEKFETDSLNYDLINNLETFGFMNRNQNVENKALSPIQTKVSIDDEKSSFKVQKKQEITTGNEQNLINSQIELKKNNEEGKIEMNKRDQKKEEHDQDSDDENNLIIDVDMSINQSQNAHDAEEHKLTANQNNSDNSSDIDDMGPASPEHENISLDKTISNTEINEKISPKVIPLENPNSSLKSNNNLQQNPKNLNDLMHKIHDKLLEATSIKPSQNNEKNFNSSNILTGAGKGKIEFY